MKVLLLALSLIVGFDLELALAQFKGEIVGSGGQKFPIAVSPLRNTGSATAGNHIPSADHIRREQPDEIQEADRQQDGNDREHPIQPRFLPEHRIDIDVAAPHSSLPSTFAWGLAT